MPLDHHACPDAKQARMAASERLVSWRQNELRAMRDTNDAVSTHQRHPAC